MKTRKPVNRKRLKKPRYELSPLTPEEWEKNQALYFKLVNEVLAD